MAERHAVRRAAAATCSVSGCEEPSARSVSGKEASEKAKLSLKTKGGRAHLCRTHYRTYKKATKGDKELERLAW